MSSSSSSSSMQWTTSEGREATTDAASTGSFNHIHDQENKGNSFNNNNNNNNNNSSTTVATTTITDHHHHTTEATGALEKPDNIRNNHVDSSLIEITDDIGISPSTASALPGAVISLISQSSSPSPSTKDNHNWIQPSPPDAHPPPPPPTHHHNYHQEQQHHDHPQQRYPESVSPITTANFPPLRQQSTVTARANSNIDSQSGQVDQIGVNNQSRRIQFKSFLTSPAVINESDEILHLERNGQELISFNNLKQLESDTTTNEFKSNHQQQGSPSFGRDNDNRQQQTQLELSSEGRYSRSSSGNIDTADEEDHETVEDSNNEDDDDDDNEDDYRQQRIHGEHLNKSPSRYKPSPTFTGRLITKFKHFGTGITNKLSGSNPSSSTISYTPFVTNTDGSDTKDLLTGTTKYRAKRHSHNNYYEKTTGTSSINSTSGGGGGGVGGRTFRGSYRYSRLGIVMALFKKLFAFLTQKSTLALVGAFLIHVTLGTVYTLSNINSYLTSYMRKHGTPNATYGGSMWISSSYAVGQGVSMVLGGYIEKRFSARLSCILGCLLHSMSIMSTSKTIDHGHIAVLLSYGFLPGFGCGLAYMTPMSNGFGWFPHRKGLVAGVILAGFGIGTFVFNMAQTAYVNPDNLSPLIDSGGYFTQDSVLNNVPGLFLFMGTIYASMQFIGCCLLFKPPNQSATSILDGKLPADEKPILVDSEVTFDKAIRTREFWVLFVVFGVTNQGVLFVNSMLKEYGQIFIKNDLFLAWTGSMASIANSMGRLVWGLAIDRFSFTQCFTSITTIFGILMFLMPFEFILSSKLLYLLCTLGIFGSFSGWMSTYPVHLSRIFGIQNSGMIYGLIFVSQSIGGIFTAFGAHYLIDNYSRFVPFFCVTCLEILGLAIYHLFYFK